MTWARDIDRNRNRYDSKTLFPPKLTLQSDRSYKAAH